MDADDGAARVVAAQSGDRPALDALLAEHLPLIYSVVGRALAGHADVDDVVQETMLRVVQGLRGLRDPYRFRSWLISIAIRQVQERGRSIGAAQARRRPLDGWPDPADPDADFEDETITRLGLSQQRREVADASRWLGPEDQRLLALWWQEVDGSLTRAEVASALGLSQAHTGVRVQRMKAQLDLARSTLRAWRASRRCPDLASAARGWDGRFDPLWLKRLGRHVRDCPVCLAASGPLVPADRLLVGAAALPVPALLAVKVAGLAASTPIGAASFGFLASVVDVLRRVMNAVTAKPAMATAGLAGATAAAVAITYLPWTQPDLPTALPTPGVSTVEAVPALGGRGPTTAPVTSGPPGPALAELYVAPNGSDTNSGTQAAPLATLGRAVALVQPGQTIVLRGGVYSVAAPVTIKTSGTASQRITLTNYPGEAPILDASAIRSNEYISHRASYWTVRGLEIRNSPGYPYVCVSCQNNVFERLSIHDNGNTGLLLEGAGSSGNQVINSDFFNNHDDANHGEGADGMAIKSGSGAGNVIRGVRTYHNADDGIDLGGFSDPVTIDNTWSYGNGVNRWDVTDFAGDGTGFKLGGGADPIPNVAHVVTNSAAWDNTGYGFTENSNHGRLVITHNTAFRNASDGFAFWYSTAELRENLALSNGRDDNKGSTATEIDNSWDQTGWSTTSLRSTDPRPAEGPRRPDGRLPVTTFLATRQRPLGAPMYDP